jgi:hypothetical protein
MDLPRVREGDPITAEAMNLLLEAAGRAMLVLGPGLQAEGNVLSALVGRAITARITGALSGGQYPWIEVEPVAGGTWNDLTRTGTAYERNSSTSVPTSTIVDIYVTPVGTYVFDAGQCP